MASAAASGNHVAFRAVRQLLAAGLHLGIAPLFSAPRRLERVALQTWAGGMRCVDCINPTRNDKT